MTDKITVRTPDGMSAELMEVYHKTNNEHRLSRNAWYVAIFAAFLKVVRGIDGP